MLGATLMCALISVMLSACIAPSAVDTGTPGALATTTPTETSATPSPTPGATVAAFYGDSYTRGAGASSPDARWSSIVSAERGWYEFNPSVDGLGFVNRRGGGVSGEPVDLVGDIVDHEPAPDVVIVTMGLNDNFSMPRRAAEIEAAITADLERLRTELPDARLVVVEPFWYRADRPPSVDQIIGWIEDGAAQVGADHIAGASRWMEGHPEWVAADGIHPNDEGYAEIARRMDAELERFGL